MNTNEERMRILRMVEEGKVSADDAARLLGALSDDPSRALRAPLARWLRIRVTDLNSGRSQVEVNVPAELVRAAGRFGARFVPSDEVDIEALLEAVRTGAHGRLVDVKDLEEGKHVEIFVE